MEWEGGYLAPRTLHWASQTGVHVPRFTLLGSCAGGLGLECRMKGCDEWGGDGPERPGPSIGGGLSTLENFKVHETRHIFPVPSSAI